MRKKVLTLDDLYSFFAEQGQNQTFSCSNSGFEVTVSSKGTFEVEKDDPSEGLMYCKIKAFHDLKNLNGSYIDTENLKAALPTMKDRPILADIIDADEDEDGNVIKDFSGHTIEVDPDTDELIYIEKPIGHFVNPEDFHLEYDEENERNFAMGDCVIYESYTDACDILRRRQTVDCSVELCIREMSYDAKNKVLNIKSFYVQGCTLLGAKVAPGMKGSKLTISDFSKQNNSTFSSEALIESLERLNQTLSDFNNKYNYKEGGTQLSLFEELLSKYNKTVDDINFEYEGLSDEELTAKFAKAFEESNEEHIEEEHNENTEENAEKITEEDEVIEEEVAEDTEGTEEEPEENFEEETAASAEEHITYESYSINKSDGTVSTYSLSLSEIQNALYTLVNNTYSADETWYGVIVYEDNTLIMIDYCRDGNCYRQSFTRDEDEFALVGERVKVHCIYVTDEEEAVLNESKQNYERVKDELSQYQAKEEKEKKDALIKSKEYSSIIESDEYKDVVTNIDHYSYNELVEKMDNILLSYVKSGKANFAKEEQTTHGVILPTKDKNKKSRYGNLFSK